LSEFAGEITYTQAFASEGASPTDCKWPFFFGRIVLDRVKLDHIIALVNGIIHPAGLDCVEAEWAGHDKTLRLFVDKLGGDGGVMLEDCVKASRLLDEVAELDEEMPAQYHLEVSTPGVERPLRLQRDFEQHIGATIQVKLSEKIQNRRNGMGRLVQVSHPGDGQDKTLITLETEQGPWSFPLASLQRASLVYDWDAHQ